MSDMVRVCAPDSAVRAVQVNGREFRSRDGQYLMPAESAKKLVESGGFMPNVLNGKATGGYLCKCGFGSWFKVCSRCGGDCEKA